MTVERSKNAKYVEAYRLREAAKREAMGVADVTLPLPASVSQMAADVCKRDGFESLTEMLITLIRVAYAGEPVVIPASGYTPKQKHLAKLDTLTSETRMRRRLVEVENLIAQHGTMTGDTTEQRYEDLCDEQESLTLALQQEVAQ